MMIWMKDGKMKFKIFDAHIHCGNSWNNEYIQKIGCTTSEVDETLKDHDMSGGLITTTDSYKNLELFGELLKKGIIDGWRDWNSFFPQKKTKFKYCYWYSLKDKHKDSNCIIKHTSAVKIHPSIDDTPITSKKYIPIIDWCEKNNKTIFVHTGRYAKGSWTHLLKAVMMYPKVNFVALHSGGQGFKTKIDMFNCIKESVGYCPPNLFFDTSTTQEPWALDYGIQLFGAKKFVFGSDYPINSMAQSIQTIHDLQITDKEKQMIFKDNLMRLIK